MAKLSIRIGNSLPEVAAALDQAEKWLSGKQAPAGAKSFASLAIEELGTNWIKYGCRDAAGHFMEFDLALDAGRLVLETTDDGSAFNPLDAPEPATHLPIEQREPGGLGILLLRKMADRMCYEFRGGLNLLTLEKTFLRTDHGQP
jgi:anti-sigma regulatory factor (Ser/Thr protein kinase)